MKRIVGGKAIRLLPCAAAGLICVTSASGSALAQGLTAVVESEILVPAGAMWRYFPGVAEPSGGTLDWTRPHFDDASWQSGAAGFGYGDQDDSTVLNNMVNRFTTVYARRELAIDDPDELGHLELWIDYDDGFVAYLNGTEIARANSGSAGSIPEFDSEATDSHEAGEVEIFPVANARSILVAGRNMLAVVGLNNEIDSGDFSLHAQLRAGGAAARGCGGDIYVAGPRVVLGGIASAPATAGVFVNDAPAAFDAATGAWSLESVLDGASHAFHVEARAAGGSVLATQSLNVIRVTLLGGEIAVDTQLEAAASPYLVSTPLFVPAGRRLTFAAGATVYLAPGVGMRIEGELQGLGTPAEPILFTRVPCQANWGFIDFVGAIGANVFRHCEWSWATGDPGCLTADESSLELESCVLRDVNGEGVHSTRSRAHVRRTLTERTNEALSLDSGDVIVEFCTVRDAIGKSDLIDSNRSNDPPARISFNHIYNTTDDGIDVDGGSLIAVGNIIHDCGDQALSLVGEGSSTILRNLCFRNGNGLSVKDAHVCVAEFNTFALNTVTGARAIEKTVGRGGGIITLRNSIVWGNAAQFVIESEGVIDVSFSNVDGTLVPGEGNISLDPRFADLANADFRLLPGSPCIGSADGGADMGALPFEIGPRSPTELKVEEIAPHSLAVSWNDNSFVEEGFDVERAVEAGPFESHRRLPADFTSFVDDGLAVGVAYSYRVRAFNQAGASEPAGPITGRTGLLPPKVSAIEPATGPLRGGTEVVIRGRNFHGTAGARFGVTSLGDVRVVSAAEIRATTPAGPGGAVDLVVETSAGSAILPAAFTYLEVLQRGDADASGARDIADAIYILRYLFQGGEPLACFEAGDANGDSDLDLSDAVILLFFLFAGGPAPSPEVANCE